MKIGILALQGNFASHAKIIEKLGGQVEFVKHSEQLQNVDGLILPGGESTALTKLLNANDMSEAIQKFAQSGRPILGTCAGLILMAKSLKDVDPLVKPLELIDVTVERNAYGPQIHSNFQEISMKDGQKLSGMCFIRAPKIIEIGPNIDILARCESGRPCAVRDKNCIALACHPEITGESYFHKLAFFK